MIILGVTAPLSWNNAAAIVKDGTFLAAAEEERFNRVKHAPRMPPFKATEFCLQYAKVEPAEIDVIAVGYRSPFHAYALSIVENLKKRNWVRLIREGGAFAEYYVGWIRYKEWLEKSGVNFQKTKVVFVPHHLAHAASAFRCSGFSESNIITLDGQGEDDAGMLGYTSPAGSIIQLEKIGHHQSLGWVYGETTDLLGFKSHSHEGKVMGLAAWGRKTADFPYLKLVNNGYELDRGWEKVFWNRFGPRRRKDEELAERHKNIALTTQHFVEQAGVRLATKLYGRTKMKNLCLAGGVALNCDMNAKIAKLPFVENIFIQPAAHDAGTAIGAALEVAAQYKEPADFKMEHAYWGPEYKDADIEKLLKESGVSYRKVAYIEKLAARLISKGKIIGWFQGRSEIGPRALGNRSILAHPGIRGMKDKVNVRVKHRESWRPFAPSILHEDGNNFFENYRESPFMLLTFRAKNSHKKLISQAIHVDDSARIQSVRKKTNARYYSLIKEFQKLTRIPAVLNTSFNDNEEPLVNSPKDALKTFFGTGLDALVLGNYLINK